MAIIFCRHLHHPHVLFRHHPIAAVGEVSAGLSRIGQPIRDGDFGETHGISTGLGWRMVIFFPRKSKKQLGDTNRRLYP